MTGQQRVRHGIASNAEALHITTSDGDSDVIPVRYVPPVWCLCGQRWTQPESDQAVAMAAGQGLMAGLLLDAILHLDGLLPEEIS